MEKPHKTMGIHRFYAIMLHESLCLNEIRTNPHGADLDRAVTPQGFVTGTAGIKYLAANLERSPFDP
jgi:hypothetical protein